MNTNVVLMEELGTKKVRKEIKFHGKYIQLVLDGDKKITVRRYDPKYVLRENEIVLGRFLTHPLHTILHLRITSVEILPLIGLTEEIAEEDGFDSVRGLIDGMEEYYEGLENHTPMAVIRFEVINV